MSTIVKCKVPVEEFALERTFDEVPSMEVEGERVVETGDRTSMPIVWARARDVDRKSLDSSLDADDSVGDYSVLASFDGEWLYRIRWRRRTEFVIKVLLDAHGTILDIHGSATGWRFRVFYPGRDSVSDPGDRGEKHGFDVDVQSVRKIDEQPSGRFGLSPDQYRAIVTACEMGYFDVPRRVQLADVADALDISHQALSERLRRAHANLLETTLAIGHNH